MSRFIYIILFCFSSYLGLSQTDIKPFSSHNQSPLIHTLGLPYIEGGRMVDKKNFTISSNFYLVSNSTNAVTQNEIVYFDGEMARLDLNARYGLTKWIEIGINLPLINHSGGFMDMGIDRFHDVLGLPGGIRSQISRNDMLYAYNQNDDSFFYITESSFGLGDLSFELGFKLLDNKSCAMALRSYLKLNNANKVKLLGSGTVDFSSQFSGQINGLGNRAIFFFYSLGYLRVGKGSLLDTIQNRNIAFASLGLAIKANSWFAPKMQFDYHSKCYKQSKTQELGDFGLQFSLGADFIMNKKMILTAGFSEDIKINTSPDFVFHLGLSYTFKPFKI